MQKNEKYDHRTIEPKWMKKWEEAGLYKTSLKGTKLYCLDMFPYPSGAGLHVGHVRIYTASDVISRYFRMKGFQVLHPMGWDAFGLPAENDAIRSKVNPNKLVPANIATFKRQMKMMGFSYDWDKEVNTSDPEYYRWTQLLFLKLYKKGLVYRANVPINWCPFCKTGLANEEVLSGGIHERCGKSVTKKDMNQWLFKITGYADRLLTDLQRLDWPEGILEMQRNWIGRSEGITIDYPAYTSESEVSAGKPVGTISCYTTRPDTNFGATFVVIAPELQTVLGLTTEKNLESVKRYIEQAKKKSEMERVDLAKEKTGVFTGSYCLNRLTGKKMPIWVSDFVVLTAGTGMVVGVPAHDERDWQFAKKYGLEITPVIKPKNGQWNFKKGPFTDIDEVEVFNSDFLNGLPALKAKDEIIDYLVGKKWGRKAVNYHLRDWVFSRQRYWGEPIPLVYCRKCGDENGVVPMPEEQLPLELPYVEHYEPTGTGESPLANIKEWVNTACPKCGGPARRETDTMPNWAGSCWYFLRFTDPHNKKFPFDKVKVNYWAPVDWYLGGAEHAVLHLLYARFWVKAFYDLDLISFKEPFMKLRNVGMVLAEDGKKMSKSLGNVINPDEVAAAFGSDTLRIYEMFIAPFSQSVAWNTTGVEGAYRFVKRVTHLCQKKIAARESGIELKSKLHRLIKKIGGDIEATKFNTAVAAMMEFINFWQDDPKGLTKEDAGKFLQILAPFAPYMTEELWEKSGHQFSIHTSGWPAYEEKLIKEETATIVVQVNGKLREKLAVSSQLSAIRSEVENLAKTSERVKKYLEGNRIKKVVFVPGKLINFVISE